MGVRKHFRQASKFRASAGKPCGIADIGHEHPARTKRTAHGAVILHRGQRAGSVGTGEHVAHDHIHRTGFDGVGERAGLRNLDGNRGIEGIVHEPRKIGVELDCDVATCPPMLHITRQRAARSTQMHRGERLRQRGTLDKGSDPAHVVVLEHLRRAGHNVRRRHVVDLQNVGAVALWVGDDGGGARGDRVGAGDAPFGSAGLAARVGHRQISIG